jgi:hypothetical protein
MSVDPTGRAGTATLALLLSVAGAHAQNAAPAPPSDVSRQGGSLSEKLNSSNGVIHPDGEVDPGMQKQAPQTGNTPVVPPPGSPGNFSGETPK